ncbi:putative transporter [Dysgonomonas sp. 25]|uniref:putative transporter n=1 Tax=Dysgonomonas sp. 25 TaxID=2302933 RepID=UPI0013D4CA14|nr:putative transporter [Dysgonomonas sp. 25]NDV68477.1 putative transporter [Dysgonomonas sp. 25]
MNWLTETLLLPSSIQAVIVLSVVSAIGLQLGKIKIFNISLGITFVFFVGIIVGHFDLDMNKDMLQYAQNASLVLFVYALGLQVGPSFFSSLKKGGFRLNMLSFGLILTSFILTIIFSYATDISLPNLIGILSGATTNTPVLGAAQEAMTQIATEDSSVLSGMASACAVAYPMGVVGVILAVAVMRVFWGPKEDSDVSHQKKDTETYVSEFLIVNPAVDGLTVGELMKQSPKKFVISRLWRDGKVTIPISTTQLQLHDHLLIISIKSDTDSIKLLLGEQENVDWNKEDIDWNHIDNSQLVSRRIIVTKSKINGVKLGTLRLRNTYNINITRINRAGFDLYPSPDLTLQIGDRLTVVGETGAINAVAKILGDEIKRLQKPNLIAIFVGIALGLVLGAIPLPFPGLSIPVKLGIAGGPIIIGILMGAYGPRFHVTTYATQSTNLFMRQFGIVVYLACLGISAGGDFFDTVFRPEGALWVGVGAILTILPVALVGFVAIKIMGVSYEKTCGMLSGSMANPMALDYANSTVDGDEPAAAYATVYPVAMFARIILTQVLLLVFL